MERWKRREATLRRMASQALKTTGRTRDSELKEQNTL
jgi:hypothetical protein